MRKLIATASALAVLALPAAAWANAPDGTIPEPVLKTDEHASVVGKYSSQITQNGQWISGRNPYAEVLEWANQTRYPGSRADIVQGYLGH
jgi:hypothetical protein